MFCATVAISPFTKLSSFIGELSQANDLELSSNSPIGYLLPSMKEHGRRALLFVECLARAHNDIVMERRTVQGDQTEYVIIAIYFNISYSFPFKALRPNLDVKLS